MIHLLPVLIGEEITRKKKMSTLDTFQALFSRDLHELRQLHKHWWSILSLSRVVKAEHLGRCCYLAEELLSPADLRTLKQEVGLDERQWRTYKAKISGQ